MCGARRPAPSVRPAAGPRERSVLSGRAGSAGSLAHGLREVADEAVGAGPIRYAIRVKDGRWSETGESSRDGISWSPFFEMTLARKQ